MYCRCSPHCAPLHRNFSFFTILFRSAHLLCLGSTHTFHYPLSVSVAYFLYQNNCRLSSFLPLLVVVVVSSSSSSFGFCIIFQFAVNATAYPSNCCQIGNSFFSPFYDHLQTIFTQHQVDFVSLCSVFPQIIVLSLIFMVYSYTACLPSLQWNKWYNKYFFP